MPNVRTSAPITSLPLCSRVPPAPSAVPGTFRTYWYQGAWHEGGFAHHQERGRERFWGFQLLIRWQIPQGRRSGHSVRARFFPERCWGGGGRECEGTPRLC